MIHSPLNQRFKFGDGFRNCGSTSLHQSPQAVVNPLRRQVEIGSTEWRRSAPVTHPFDIRSWHSLVRSYLMHAKFHRTVVTIGHTVRPYYRNILSNVNNYSRTNVRERNQTSDMPYANPNYKPHHYWHTYMGHFLEPYRPWEYPICRVNEFIIQFTKPPGIAETFKLHIVGWHQRYDVRSYIGRLKQVKRTVTIVHHTIADTSPIPTVITRNDASTTGSTDI